MPLQGPHNFLVALLSLVIVLVAIVIVWAFKDQVLKLIAQGTAKEVPIFGATIAGGFLILVVIIDQVVNDGALMDTVLSFILYLFSQMTGT